MHFHTGPVYTRCRPAVNRLDFAAAAAVPDGTRALRHNGRRGDPAQPQLELESGRHCLTFALDAAPGTEPPSADDPKIRPAHRKTNP